MPLHTLFHPSISLLTEVTLTGHAQPPAWADPSGGAGAGTTSSDQQATPLQRQQHQFDFLQQPHNYIAHPRSLPGTPATRPVILEDVTSNNASGVGPPGGGGLGANTNFLFPQPIPKSRSKSDTALEPPNWDTSATAAFVNQSQNNSAVDDGPSPGTGTVNMQEVQGQGVSYTSPPSTGHSLQNFNFPANNSSPNNGYLSTHRPCITIGKAIYHPTLHLPQRLPRPGFFHLPRHTSHAFCRRYRETLPYQLDLITDIAAPCRLPVT